MRMIILGAPGSGKGTQSARVAEKYGVPAISTGEIFRHNIKTGTDLGQQVKSVIEAGELVSDELTGALVRDRLQQPDAAEGFLLDGYPRNLTQVETLDAILGEHGRELQVALALKVREDEVVQRLVKRAQIEGRADDTEDVVRKRMGVYHLQTEPISAVYRDRGLLREVDGFGAQDEVFERLVAAVEAARELHGL